MNHEKKSFISEFLSTSGLPNWLTDISAAEFLRLSLIAAVVILGAAGAYLLGVLFAVPWAVARLFNEATLLHIAGDLTLLVAVGWSFFKISHLAITGLYSLWLFLLCKFIIGRKYERGLRNPIVSRYQFGRFRRFLVGKKKLILFGQVCLTVIFLYSLFFNFSNEPIVVVPNISKLFSTILFGGIPLAIFGTLAAFQVGSKISHREFLLTSDGRLLLILVFLLVIAVLGTWRTYALSASKAFHFPTEFGTCELAPMFPVFGGNLFFEKQSQSYVVFDNLGRGMYWRKRSDLAPPACLPDGGS